MADPFALMNRTLDRNQKRVAGGRQSKSRDLHNPADLERIRALHPDFDKVMGLADLDYKTMCRADADFAKHFPIPPLMEPVREFREHSNSVDAVCWDPNRGSFVSASHDSTLKVWDVTSGRCLRTLSDHDGGVYHCAVASTGRHMISCGSGTKNVLLWEWPQGEKGRVLKGHRKAVYHATFSPDGLSAATADQEGNIAVHDIGSGSGNRHRLLSLHVGVAHGSSFCRDDPSLLCSVGSDGGLQVVDLREQGPSQFWSLPSTAANYTVLQTSLSIPSAHGGDIVYAAEFVDRDTIFTTGADHKLKRWDLRRVPRAPLRAADRGGACARDYLGHSAPLRSLAVSSDRRYLVSGCEDGSCRVWCRDELELTGHNTAMLLLSGHVDIVSGCVWQEDRENRRASVLSCSWDQSIKLFTVDLQ